MPGLVIGDVFRNAARAVPGRVAAVHGTAALTFGALDEASNRLAHALAGRGVRRSDRVVVETPTSLHVVALFAAAAKLGAVFVPIAAGGPAAATADVLDVARPALHVTPDLLTDLVSEARSESSTALPDTVAEGDPHVIFCTSGSTGQPKGVLLSHRTNYLRSHPGSQLEPRGVLVCPYPLFHMAAWTLALQQWQARDAIVYVDRADGASITSAIREHAAARLNAVPAVWQRILDHLGPAGRLPTLRIADTGTSATPPELLAAIAGACPNATLRVFYGSTEAGNVASLVGDEVFDHPGSCGVPATSAEVRLTSEGELCVRGPLLFDGYFGDPAATATAVVDGWFHTGDVASLDAAGYLSIVGRVGDLIRTGGEAVAPVEVEAVLAEHPGVGDVAVVGIRDDRWGEAVCAVVVPRDPAAPPSLDELRAHCTGRLAAAKHPRRLHISAELPRTAATGQLQRKAIVAAVNALSIASDGAPTETLTEASR